VCEDLPDASMRRPEISTALAAVVDHATAKDLDRRYQNAEALAADLEDVLAIETARAGQATGEATTVLRTLPGSARRRLPWRARIPRLAVVALLLLTAAAIVAAVLLARDNTERGIKPPGVKPQAPGLQVVALRSKAAHDYDPFGGDGEHSEETSAAIDDDSKSTWSTESYEAATLNKPGVGLYVDAAPGVAAKRMELRTTTPGWSGAVYAAEDGPPKEFDDPGWTKVASLHDVKRSQQISLDTAGKEFRYYLVWITDLPPDSRNATISDLALLK
jgi:serine/threonine-protein kinase